MSQEKENLMKTLKDENLRAETRKFTRNLLNAPKTSKSFISSPNNNNKNLHSMMDINNISEIKSNNTNINNSEKASTKKKKKKIKKKKDGENILKPGESIKKGQKYKLLIKKDLNDEKINDDQNNEDKEQNKNDIIKENKENSNSKEKEPIKKDNEVKPIIKDKEKEKKTNKNQRDILNSFKNLQYNFDNLMEIGVHGNKVLNNNK